MKISLKLKIVVSLLVLISIWVGVALVKGLPLLKTDSFICPYCRAVKTHDTCMGIILPDKVTKLHFTDYYFKSVDASHTHKWVSNESIVRLTRDGVYNSSQVNTEPAWGVNSFVLEAICKTLPNPRARRIFINNLNARLSEGKDQRIALFYQSQFARVIYKSYDDNPKRKDWVPILQKYGLYPGGKYKRYLGWLGLGYVPIHRVPKVYK